MSAPCNAIFHHYHAQHASPSNSIVPLSVFKHTSLNIRTFVHSYFCTFVHLCICYMFLFNFPLTLAMIATSVAAPPANVESSTQRSLATVQVRTEYRRKCTVRNRFDHCTSKCAVRMCFDDLSIELVPVGEIESRKCVCVDNLSRPRACDANPAQCSLNVRSMLANVRVAFDRFRFRRISAFWSFFAES